MKEKYYDVHLCTLNIAEMYPLRFTLQQGEIFIKRLYIKEHVTYDDFGNKKISSLLLRNMKI